MEGKPKRKRSLNWWDWSAPIPFAYELDASIEYAVQEIRSLFHPVYWFMDGLQVDIKPDEEQDTYIFRICVLKASSKTPSSAYVAGRVYKDSRSTVIIEGSAQIDMKRFYRSQLPAIVFMLLFFIVSNICLLAIEEIRCMLLPVNITFLMVAAMSEDLSFPHREQKKVLDHIERAVDTINKSKNPYYKPPKPIRSREKSRPATMQRRPDE